MSGKIDPSLVGIGILALITIMVILVAKFARSEDKPGDRKSRLLGVLMLVNGGATLSLWQWDNLRQTISEIPRSATVDAAPALEHALSFATRMEYGSLALLALAVFVAIVPARSKSRNSTIGASEPAQPKGSAT